MTIEQVTVVLLLGAAIGFFFGWLFGEFRGQERMRKRYENNGHYPNYRYDNGN